MDKQEKIEEIWELMTIPGVAEFLFSALEQAKKKFKDQIQQYREAKNKLKEEKKQEVRPPGLNELSTDKSYFFNIIRTEDAESDGYQWVVEEFRFKDNPGIINFIFSDFIKMIDQLEIDPQQIKTYVVHSSTGRYFEINFTKSSAIHVGGFVKARSSKEAKPRADDFKVIKVSRKHEGIDEEEMYQKIVQFMKENPKVREDIFFYYQMAQKSKEEFFKQPTKS